MPEDMDKSQLGLHRVYVQVLEGYILISFADDPSNFLPVIRDLGAHWEPHDFANAKICHTDSLEIRANWKILVENARECYHCAGGHPELCRVLILAAAVGRSHLAAEEQRLTELAEVRWQQMGLSTVRIRQTTETWHQAFRVPFFKDSVSLSIDGQRVAPLMGRLQQRDVGLLNSALLPSFWLEASGDLAAVYRYIPVSPTLTKMQIDWLVRGDAVEGVDYEVNRVTEMLKIVNDQDFRLCEGTQAGVNSCHYQHGPYADVECHMETFVRWYLSQLADVAP